MVESSKKGQSQIDGSSISRLRDDTPPRANAYAVASLPQTEDPVPELAREALEGLTEVCIATNAIRSCCVAIETYNIFGGKTTSGLDPVFTATCEVVTVEDCQTRFFDILLMPMKGKTTAAKKFLRVERRLNCECSGQKFVAFVRRVYQDSEVLLGVITRGKEDCGQYGLNVEVDKSAGFLVQNKKCDSAMCCKCCGKCNTVHFNVMRKPQLEPVGEFVKIWRACTPSILTPIHTHGTFPVKASWNEKAVLLATMVWSISEILHDPCQCCARD